MHYQIIVEMGGGRFRGVQRGDADLNLDPLILFDDAALPPNKSSSMALKPIDLTADNVRSAIANMRETYKAAALGSLQRAFEVEAA